MDGYKYGKVKIETWFDGFPDKNIYQNQDETTICFEGKRQ